MRILFVCTGNTCRSPMAEAILKSKNHADWEVKSAGIFAANGSDASHQAKQVLEEKNIKHEHQSSMLTKELVDWATYIFAMTASHKDSILNMYPDAKTKTFTLKEFAGHEKGDISDPFGAPVEQYRRTYAEIENCIDEIITKLESMREEEDGGEKEL